MIDSLYAARKEIKISIKLWTHKELQRLKEAYLRGHEEDLRNFATSSIEHQIIEELNNELTKAEDKVKQIKKQLND